MGVPFFVEKNLVQIKQREDSLTIKAINCTGYDFKTEKDGKRFAGTVWLNPVTASPMQVDMQLTEDQPLKFDDMEIDHFYRTIELEEKDGVIKAKRFTAEAWCEQSIHLPTQSRCPTLRCFPAKAAGRRCDSKSLSIAMKQNTPSLFENLQEFHSPKILGEVNDQYIQNREDQGT